jgi:hypothetical protein
MGLLFVGALAGILISLAWFVPSQGYSGYASRLYVDEVGSGRPLEPRPVALVPAPAIAKAAPAISIASSKRSSAKKRPPVKRAKDTPVRTKKTSVAASDRPADLPDSVLSKAKATIAAKMEDPGSAEFGDMKRAMRKNTFGRPVDTICGHVKEKTASGGEAAERPFLYLVKENDAYVVDGKANSAAAIAYRNICN